MLRGKYILLFLDKMSCRCLHDMSIDENGVLKSPTIIVCGGICALNFTRISFTNMGFLVFGA